jgi:hypothetical protein
MTSDTYARPLYRCPTGRFIVVESPIDGIEPASVAQFIAGDVLMLETATGYAPGLARRLTKALVGPDTLGPMDPEAEDGFMAFWSGQRAPHCPGSQLLTAGWWKGYAMAYALGACAFQWANITAPLCPMEEKAPYNPFPQFHAAWEAWADGFESEAIA